MSKPLDINIALNTAPPKFTFVGPRKVVDQAGQLWSVEPEGHFHTNDDGTVDVRLTLTPTGRKAVKRTRELWNQATLSTVKDAGLLVAGDSE